MPRLPAPILITVLFLMGCAAEPIVYFPNNPFRKVDCDGLSISHDLSAVGCKAGMENAPSGTLSVYRELRMSEGIGWELYIDRQTGTGTTYFERLSVIDVLSGTPADDEGYRWGREREYGAYKYVRYAQPKLFNAPKEYRNDDPAACFHFVRYAGNRFGGAAERIRGFYCKQSKTAIPIKEVEDILSKITIQDYRTAS